VIKKKFHRTKTSNSLINSIMGNKCCHHCHVEEWARTPLFDESIGQVEKIFQGGSSSEERRQPSDDTDHERRETKNSPLGASYNTQAMTDSIRSEDYMHVDIIKEDIMHHDVSCSSICSDIVFEHHQPSPFTEDEILRLAPLLKSPIQGELGAVRYETSSVEEAKKIAQERNMPIFCIQAEVPGDIESGKDVLSHPLIVEALESMFVCAAPKIPRKEFEDRYKPSAGRKAWYTTINFLDANGEELVPAIGGDTLVVPVIVDCIVRVLTQCKRPIPRYVSLLQEEQCGKSTIGCSGRAKRNCRCIVFGIHDYDRTEVEFAKIDGVLATICGTYIGNRVIRIVYNPKVLSFTTILHYSTERHLADTIYYQTQDEKVAAQMETSRLVEKPAIVKMEHLFKIVVHDMKSALRRSLLGKVPLTDLQATRINLLIHQGQFHEATRLLSPRQFQVTRTPSERGPM
jgi:hypothetical protein